MPVHLDKTLCDCDPSKTFLSDRTSLWSFCWNPSLCAEEVHEFGNIVLVSKHEQSVSQAFHNRQATYQDETLDEIPRLLNNAMTTNEEGDRSQIPIVLGGASSLISAHRAKINRA